MFDRFIYFVALGAPELADGLAGAGGQLVEAVGRRAAAGGYEKVAARVQKDSQSFIAALVPGALGGGLSSLTGRLLQSAIAAALQAEGASLIAREELDLLRELATAAAAHSGNLQASIAKLTAYHRRQAAAA